MLMKKLLSTLFLGLFLIPMGHAQKIDQSAVIAGGIFLNIFKLPEELVWAITSPAKAAQYRKLTDTTKAMGDADLKNEDLNCEQKCANDLRILSDARNRMIPDSGEHLLSFLNEKKDFADHIQRTVGYCWGHTSVTRNFNYLAHFDPSLKKEEPKAYRKIIRKIMRGKAQIIPGYANLREFSAEPEIMVALKDQVVWKWLEKAMRVRSIGTSLRGMKGLMEKEELFGFIDQVKEKLSVNHTPKIFFTNLKKPGFIHIVSIYNVVEEENQIKLCILDNHEYEDQLKDCGVFVTVKKDGSENFYKGWENPSIEREGFVGQFGFTPEDDLEILKFQKENTKLCLEKCK
jgi:hypothetical protein